MLDIWRSFWSGCGAAARLWPVALLLYLVDTAFAAILAAPAVVHLDRVFGHSAMASDLLGPVTLNLLLEATGGTETVPLPWPIFILVPVISVMTGTFMRGGILGILVGERQGFRWTDFFADCARYFGRLLVLLLLFLPGLAVVPVLLGAASLRVTSGAAALVTSLAVAGLYTLLLVSAMDYARISLVSEPERSVFRHFARGIGFVIRRLPRALALALAFSLIAALIAGLYPALLVLVPASGGLVTGLLIQQLSVLLASWQRVAMLGGEAELFRRVAPRGRAVEPPGVAIQPGTPT